LEHISRIPIDKIKPNPYQPDSRIKITEEKAAEFGQSILNHGLLQIPRVRPSDGPGIYEMGDGWQRLRGYKWLVDLGHLEYQEIPAIIENLSDRQMADMVLETNNIRHDLNPIELAMVYQKYLNSFNITQMELAQARNRSQGEISNTLRLLDLPQEVQAMVISRDITETHARHLLQLSDKKQIMGIMAKKIREYGWSVSVLDANIKSFINESKPPLPETSMPPVKEAEKTETELSPCNTSDAAGTIAPRKETTAQSVTPSPTSTPQAPVPVSEIKEPEQEEPTTPAKIPFPRKLTLTEMPSGNVYAGITRLGNNPYMRTIEGDMEIAIEVLHGFIIEAESWWEEQKNKEAK